MSHRFSRLLLLLGLCACATLDSAGEVTYLPDAVGNFDAGEKALKSGRHLDALKFFDHVRYKYPYSAQAALADLAIADTNFEREKYLEAIDGYRNFLKLHPNHSKADYAQYRIAFSYYKDISSDFFLFPPSAEKDQTSVKDARSAFEEFLKLYPKSELAAEASKNLTDVTTRLAKHEMSVASFYYEHDHYASAIGRFTRVIEDYPKCEYAPEALVKLARSHLALLHKDKAREALQKLLKDYPDDSHRSEAEKLLKSIG
jgi:outer membrane protein assembly factor BamD